ncbi:MAG: hydantoinase/oxoprolinase family protein [Phycisphaerales bacterium]
MAERPWRVGVDVGGTFADCVGVLPTGEVRRLKLLTNGRRRAACTPGSAPHTLRAAALPAWCLPALVGAEAVAASGAAARVVEAAVEDAPPEAASAAGQPPLPPRQFPRTLLTLADPLPATPWVDLHAPGLEAPAWGAHLLTGTPQGTPLPPLTLHLSTTRGTNALLEGHVRTTGLVVNAGLEGVLAIGTQQRLGIFDLAPRKPPELAAATVGVSARLDAAGAELAPVVEAKVHAAASALRAAGVEHVAVALMHSWRNPAHEQAVAALLRQHGFASVCTSSELSTTPRLVPRAQAAVVEARLHQPVRTYLQRVAAGLGASTLRVAASSGGVVPAAQFRAKDSLLSGPAAGCNGALAAMRAEGIQQAVTLDMGGTSTDVARLDQHGVAIRLEADVAGVAVATPSVDVRSVAAGGGGICVATAEGLFVGPRSAGADPGPACYGRGGPLTLTDVNLLLGRLWTGAGSLPLDSAAAGAAAQAQADASGRPLETMLHGLLEVAHEHMAAAVRTVCTHAGHDPRQHVLLAFGGAGGQHACAVAQRLGMASVLVVPDAGFVSAHGALHARMEHTAEAPLLEPLGDGHALHQAAHRLQRQARAGLEAMGADAASPQHARLLVALRAPGRTGVHVVDVALDQPAHAMASAARAAYHARLEALGDPAAALEPLVDTVRVAVAAQVEVASTPAGAASATTASTATAAPSAASAPPAAAAPLPAPIATTTPHATARHPAWPVHAWASLPVGAALAGPALVVDEGATVVVEPGWTCTRTAHHALRLHAVAPLPASPTAEVDLEVAAARFIGTGAWMGTCLERSAVSVNVKERLDFSCGILDPDARLVANAPHIPVHLGALGACVRAMRTRVAFDPGVLVLTNDLRCGGSHLPDITLARAVHARWHPAGLRGGPRAPCRSGWHGARQHAARRTQPG